MLLFQESKDDCSYRTEGVKSFEINLKKMNFVPSNNMTISSCLKKCNTTAATD